MKLCDTKDPPETTTMETLQLPNRIPLSSPCFCLIQQGPKDNCFLNCMLSGNSQQFILEDRLLQTP